VRVATINAALAGEASVGFDNGILGQASLAF
jgi:hypothetical protein